ncbi:MFS family permease [Psychromicrobium silvestre]|uniref:MFS family permease n=1 Tax=Psychromicrobium silvestre TaxID=1645614 RepID=A0A7Y9LUK8_9MICC|nr:MFS family permease [Psychromicrobium silvestre]
MPANKGEGRTRLGRFVPLLLAAQLGWSIPNNAASALLQAGSSTIAPNDKIGFYATMSTIGAILAVVAIILGGALSDRTRTRFGKRIPWIIGGSVLATLGLFSTGLTTNPVLVIAGFALYQMALNAMLGAIFALTPDYLAQSVLGRASAVSGAGVLLGGILGGIISAIFITVPQQGLMIIPWLILIAAIVLGIFLPPRPNVDEARESLSLLGFLKYLRPPKDGQFWWVFAGRFLFILALFMTVQYQYFIATEYLGLETQAAGNLLALTSIVLAICAGAATLVAGPLSDRIGRKPFVIGAPLMAAVGVLPLIFAHQPWALVVFFVLGGLAYGGYLSVDAALMVEVLPNQESTAKDLAVLNAANSLPLVFAPALAGLLVTIGGYQGSFIATVVTAVAGAVCIFFVKRVR